MGRTGQVVLDEGDPDVVDWSLIPPRAWDVLWFLIWPSRHGEPLAADALVLERVGANGRFLWRIQSGRDDKRTFSSVGVNLLVRMGLLVLHEGQDDQLILTPKGLASCQVFWRRWEGIYPTLTLMGMRF